MENKRVKLPKQIIRKILLSIDLLTFSKNPVYLTWLMSSKPYKDFKYYFEKYVNGQFNNYKMMAKSHYQKTDLGLTKTYLNILKYDSEKYIIRILVKKYTNKSQHVINKNYKTSYKTYIVGKRLVREIFFDLLCDIFFDQYEKTLKENDFEVDLISQCDTEKFSWLNYLISLITKQCKLFKFENKYLINGKDKCRF